MMKMEQGNIREHTKAERPLFWAKNIRHIQTLDLEDLDEDGGNVNRESL